METVEYLKRVELARKFRVRPRMVSGWVKDGCPVFYTGNKKTPGKGSRPLFVEEEVAAWLKERSRNEGGGKDGRVRTGMDAFFPNGGR